MAIKKMQIRTGDRDYRRIGKEERRAEAAGDKYVPITFSHEV